MELVRLVSSPFYLTHFSFFRRKVESVPVRLPAPKEVRRNDNGEWASELVGRQPIPKRNLV